VRFGAVGTNKCSADVNNEGEIVVIRWTKVICDETAGKESVGKTLDG
jgi:hypothetical protein